MSHRSALAAAALMFAPAPALAQTAPAEAAEPPMPIGICGVATQMGYGSDPSTGNGGFAFICGQGGAILSEPGAEMAWLSPLPGNRSTLLIGRDGQQGVCLSITVATPGATGGVDLVTQYAFVTDAGIQNMRRGQTIDMQRVGDTARLPAEAADCSAALHERTVDVVNYLGSLPTPSVEQRRVAPPAAPPRGEPVRLRRPADLIEA